VSRLAQCDWAVFIVTDTFSHIFGSTAIPRCVVTFEPVENSRYAHSNNRFCTVTWRLEALGADTPFDRASRSRTRFLDACESDAAQPPGMISSHCQGTARKNKFAVLAANAQVRTIPTYSRGNLRTTPRFELRIWDDGAAGLPRKSRVDI
jgi:hypothetical protein